MNKYLKYGLIGAAGLAALFATVVAVVSLSFDSNRLKQQLVKMVQEKKQRTLTFSGDVRLTFFPRLGVDTGRVSLSEYRGSKTFAAIESVRFYLSWFPLLHKELVMEGARIEGLRVDLVRFKDGSSNFDDLLRKEEEPPQFKFDIQSASLGHGAISWHDELAGNRFELVNLKLATGRLAENRPSSFVADFRLAGEQPRADAQIHVVGGLWFDTRSKQLAFNKSTVEAKGELAGLRDVSASATGSVVLDGRNGGLTVDGLTLALAGKRGGAEVDVRLTAPGVRYSAQEFSARKIEIAAKSRDGANTTSMVLALAAVSGTPIAFQADTRLQAEVAWNGSEIEAMLRGPLVGSVDRARLDWAGLKFDIPADRAKANNGGVKAALGGSAMVDFRNDVASFEAAGRVDASQVKVSLAAAPLSVPHLHFDAEIDRIDANRYLGAASPGGAARQETGNGMSFSAPPALSAGGVVRVGTLRLYGATASNIRLDIRVGGGSMSISPFSMVEEAVKNRIRREVKTHLEDELRLSLPPFEL